MLRTFLFAFNFLCFRLWNHFYYIIFCELPSRIVLSVTHRCHVVMQRALETCVFRYFDNFWQHRCCGSHIDFNTQLDLFGCSITHVERWLRDDCLCHIYHKTGRCFCLLFLFDSKFSFRSNRSQRKWKFCSSPYFWWFVLAWSNVSEWQHFCFTNLLPHNGGAFDVIFDSFEFSKGSAIWCYRCTSATPGCAENFHWRGIGYWGEQCPEDNDICVKVTERKRGEVISVHYEFLCIDAGMLIDIFFHFSIGYDYTWLLEHIE